jgi:hypothetical protein
MWSNRIFPEVMMCDDLATRLFLPDSLQVQSWQIQGDILTVTVQGRHAEICCPLCQVPTAHVHGRTIAIPRISPAVDAGCGW